MNGDDDVESYLDPVTLRRTVRGAEKLKGVQPDLLNHWNSLDKQFQDAGITPEIKSGFRTVAQQQALYNNPATRARTKGNDGIVNISPHQRGDALDISFSAAQKGKGRQIIANYAQANGLHVPSDEPWHIAIPRQDKAEPYLDPVSSEADKYLDPQPSSSLNAQAGMEGQQPKEKVTSEVKPVDFQGQTPQEPIADLQSQPQAKAIPFQQATEGDRTPPTLNPIENLYRVTENTPQPSGSLQQQFEQRRLKAPESTQQAQRVKLNFPSQLNPSPQDVEEAYVKALGPEYEQYNKMHVAQTGRNLVSFHPDQLAAIKREADGSFYVSPRKDSLDYLNAYVTSGGNLDKANEVVGKNRQEQFDAAQLAQQGAKQDVAEIEAARKSEGAEGSLNIPLPYDPLEPNAQKSLDVSGRAVTAPTERFIAGIGKMVGGLSSLGGLTPNQFSDYMNRKSEITQLGASLPPLTPEGKDIQKNVPEKVATALGDLGYTVFEIAVLKKVTGLSAAQVMGLETALKTSDKPAAERAVEVAKNYALGSVLDAHVGRLTSTAIMGAPAAVEGTQAALRNNDPTKPGYKDPYDVLLDTGIQGGIGAILGGGKSEGLADLGIEQASVSGVRGRGALDTDQVLAQREASVKPVTDAQGNILLNADEIARDPTAKPKIKLANQPTNEPAHPSNFQPRTEEGKFDGAPEYPEEFKPENVAVKSVADLGLSPEERAQREQPNTVPVKEPWEMKRSSVVLDETPEGNVVATDPFGNAIVKRKGGGFEVLRAGITHSTVESFTSRSGEGGLERAKRQLSIITDNSHRESVERAVSRGQPVPPEALADYPDLAKKYASTVAPQAPVEATSEPQPIETKPNEETTQPSRPLDNQVSKAPPSTTSARQAQLAKDRADLDLPDLPQVGRKGWRASLQNAQDRGLDQQAGRIADGVLEGHLKVLDDEQTAGLVLRMQQVKNEHAELQKQIYQADPKSEQFETLKAQNDILESEADKLQRAMDQSGSEKGRTLAAQKLTINQDMDLVSLITRAKAKGLEVTPERRAKYEAMDKEINGDPNAPEGSPERLGLKERARLAEEKIRTDQLQSVTERIARKTRRTQTKKTLDDEAVMIKTNIAAEFARLKTQLGSDNVRSMAGLGNLDPNGVITKNLAKYLRNRVQSGVTDAAQILDDAYNLIKEHVEGITKGDVLDALLAKSRKQRTDLAGQLADVRKQLTDLAVESGQRTAKPQGPQLGPKQGPTQAYFKTRKATLLKQETELQRRIAEQDFSGKPKRAPIIYNKELNDIQGRVESLRRQYQHDLDSAKPKTAGDLLVRWKRFAVLTYPQTFGKLTSAATARMISTPAEELAGTVLSKVPGLSEAFTGPREGPMNLSAEAKAVSQLWQSQSFKDMLSHVKGGEDLLTLLYGKGKNEFYRSAEADSLIPGRGKKGYERFADITDRPGHYHAAVKIIPKRAEFFRSFEKRLESARRLGKDVNEPSVQMGLAGQAYADSQRAILQQPNPLSEAFNRFVQGLAHSDYRINRALSNVARFEFPITRVPVNFATEAAQNIAGLPAGLGEIGIRKASEIAKPFFTESKSQFLKRLGERMPDALNELEPEQKDRIARTLKKGTIGSAFVLWGMLRPDQFGGYYQPGHRDPEDVKAGGMRFLGVNIPRWMGHIPLLEAAQFGATLRRVFDSMRAKEKTPLEAGSEGTRAAVTGLAKEVPFVQPFIDTNRGIGQVFTNPGKFAGEQVKSLEPGAGQWAARATDYSPNGSLAGALNPFGSQETVRRQQKTFGQVIKEGIPGLRETIPISDVFPKASKGSSEVQRLNVWLDGAKKSKDETMVEFHDRQETENTAIREAIENTVSNPSYQKLSDKEKAQQITASKNFAIKMTPKPIRKIKDLAPALMSPAPESAPSPNKFLY